MQIGNPDLDEVYENSIAPAIRAGGLDPKRIDLDNTGGLLKSEIINYLERSDVIVADLTNERPNCYLEVGYAMGLGRNRHLILTVQADHLPGNPGYVTGGPKVHFDLAGYDLLMWKPDALDAFRDELTRRIQRRLVITRDTPLVGAQHVDPTAGWTRELAERGTARIHELVGPGHMELAFGLTPPKIQVTARELLEAARTATIDTFGYPIGLVLDTDEYRPKLTGNGVRAEVEGGRWDGERSFDLWELRTDGDFFMVHSLFEDQRGQTGKLFVNTRVVRVTEAVLYSARLYERLGVGADAAVNLQIVHAGLTGRTLEWSAPTGASVPGSRRSAVDRAEGRVTFELGAVASQLGLLVKALLSPMFELFDFFTLSDDEYQRLVDGFVAGRLA